MFFNKNKDKKTSGFSRMIANMVDFTLLAILIDPLFRFIGNFIYGQNTPRQFLQSVLQNQENHISNFGELVNYITRNQTFTNYLHNESVIFKVILEQTIHISILAAIVIYFWNKKQATPGKMLMNLKIIDFKTGEKPTNSQYIIRFVGYIISALPLFLGYVWAIFDKNKRSLHDYLSGTQVVKKEKNI
jgi:uncharacterized RDD family membrane protein YckC